MGKNWSTPGQIPAYADMTERAQQIWAESDLAAKKQLVINMMINAFKFKQKNETLVRDLEKISDTKGVDIFVGNLLLLQSGDRVIKIK